MSKALCYLCIVPDKIACDFLTNIVGYDIYIIFDDQEIDVVTHRIII